MGEVKPGKKVGLSYDWANLSADEQSILNVFEKDWFISFAKEKEWKNIQYRYVFAKPNEILSERFRIRQDLETLILFLTSPFDSRTPDFVDRLMEGQKDGDEQRVGVFRNRLEPRKIILISQESEIREKILQYSKTHPQGRIFIPYTYAEFLQDKTHNAWDRLKEQFFGRDLFAFEQPLTSDLYFFGREDEIKELSHRCEAGLNSGLFGLRRIGKTSVLFALMRKLQADSGIAFYFKCYEPYFYEKRWWELLQLIARELFSLPHLKGKTISTDYSEKEAGKSFQVDLKQAYNLLNTRIVLIFDEIEKIMYGLSSEEHWRDGKDYRAFWQTLRGIQQTNPELFSYVLAGVNPTVLENRTVGSYDNPIYSGLHTIYLPAFRYDQVKEMVGTIGDYMGLTFDDRIFSYLADDYGGHPYLIRRACSQLHEKTKKYGRPYHIEKTTYDEYRDEIDDALIPNIREIVGVLEDYYPTEYLLLDCLATNDYESFNSYVVESDESVMHLRNYELIEKSKTNRYHLTIKAVEKFFQSRSGKPRISVGPLTDQEKWAQISERRNILEPNLRRIIRLVLKGKYSKEKGKEHFLEIITNSERRQRLNALDFNDLLSGTGDVRLDDLLSFIEKNWQDFSTIFSNLNTFQVYRPIINNAEAGRSDAHAKPISDDDFNTTMIAFKWFDEKCAEYLN